MKLTRLWHSIPGAVCCDLDPCEITGLSYDSRRVEPGFAFFAITGNADDGHRYAEDALGRGARAAVVERPLRLSRRLPQIIVKDTRKALAHAARAFFDDPSAKLKVSAVTGTNGKTSTAYLSRAMLSRAGKTAGLMSTVKIDVGSRSFPATHTTPESLEIQSCLAQMVDAGLRFAVVETSSHALHQGRFQGIAVASAVFTNLTQDHLDYHGNMENYLSAKAKLFEMLPEDGFAILNADDPASSRLSDCCRALDVTYGLKNPSDVTADVHSVTAGGTRLTLRTPAGSQEIFSPLTGNHNVYNVLAASANAQSLGVGLSAICEAIEGFTGVPGRLQRIDKGQPFTVLVDYAHTHDALQNVLEALLPLKNGGRMIVVFGCGGDRDRTKRPLMGAVVEELSDLFWITSDNPRTEDPDAIIQNIRVGLKGAETCRIEPDRRKAIYAALSSAQPGDIVLLAGKGHENDQIIGTTRIHFDDSEVAAEILSSLK
jgi:UDP-N-acetylmuramoyl-L-alanyl-D-glutamate--2,6-diaminopimelate ligase